MTGDDLLLRHVVVLLSTMSSRFNCFRDSSSPPVVISDSPTSASRCQPAAAAGRQQVPGGSLQDPAVQRCVATDLQPSCLAARRLTGGGPQARRRPAGCSNVQCATVTDGAPTGWVQLGPSTGGGCRKDLAAAVSSPGVSPSSSARSLHYVLQSPARRYRLYTHVNCQSI